MIALVAYLNLVDMIAYLKSWHFGTAYASKISGKKAYNLKEQRNRGDEQKGSEQQRDDMFLGWKWTC
jgi:hypothetical protein